MNRLQLGVFGVILVIALLAFGASQCSLSRNAATKARVEKGQTSAVIESGMEASNVQAGVAANDVASADLGRANAEDIRNAQGSDVVVADPTRAAILRSLCKRQAYRDSQQCRVQ